MTLILGIDEAGRGPVIGPMVMAGVLLERKDEAAFVKLGVKDSKLLSPHQREALFERILIAAKRYHIVTIPPAEIDRAVEGEESNLNWLEAEKSAEIINTLNPAVAYLDCPSNNINAYTAYVEKRLTVKTKIIAEHKADARYPVVSAASILAKVTRDREIAKIQKMVPHNIGSGYPADPVTAAFLKEHHAEYGEIIRKSWQSYKQLVDSKKQRRIGEYG